MDSGNENSKRSFVAPAALPDPTKLALSDKPPITRTHNKTARVDLLFQNPDLIYQPFLFGIVSQLHRKNFLTAWMELPPWPKSMNNYDRDHESGCQRFSPPFRTVGPRRYLVRCGRLGKHPLRFA